jgi:hypothetical protein
MIGLEFGVAAYIFLEGERYWSACPPPRDALVRRTMPVFVSKVVGPLGLD